jgi:hypothetical protein
MSEPPKDQPSAASMMADTLCRNQAQTHFSYFRRGTKAQSRVFITSLRCESSSVYSFHAALASLTPRVGVLHVGVLSVGFRLLLGFISWLGLSTTKNSIACL